MGWHAASLEASIKAKTQSWIFLLCLFYTNLIPAAEIVRNLSKEQDARKYAETASSLSAGEIVQFSNGKRFKIVGKLGEGGINYIYEAYAVDAEGKTGTTFALRILKKSYDGSFLTTTVEGYPQLVLNGVSVPKKIEYAEGEYILQEKIFFDYRFTELFGNKKTASGQIQREAAEAFEEFCRSVATLEIYDFAPRQIVYNSTLKKWILLDWGPVIKLSPPFNSESNALTRFEEYYSSSENPEPPTAEARALMKKGAKIVEEERLHRSFEVRDPVRERELRPRSLECREGLRRAGRGDDGRFGRENLRY